MRLLLAALLISLATPFAHAQTVRPIVTIQLEHGLKLKYSTPAGLPADAYGCIFEGNRSVGNAFTAKYPITEIWADQIQITDANGGYTYFTRISGYTGTKWIHEIYSMKTTFARGCTAGSPIYHPELSAE